MKNKKLLIILFLIVLNFAFNFRAINYEFLSDDYPLIVNNERIRNFNNFLKSATGQFFTTTEHPYLHYWRPVILFSYYLDYKIWKLNPKGYHLTNILVHTVNVILLFLILKILSNNLLFSFSSSFIFSILPAHVENIFWISGRTDLIATFFILLTTLFLIKFFKAKRYTFFILSLLSFIFSLLSKEVAAILPFILLFYLIIKRLEKIQIFKYSIPFFFIEALYIFFHIRFSHANSVLKRLSLKDIPDTIKALGIYFKIMFFPVFKTFYISMKEFDSTKFEYYLLAILFFILILFIYKYKNTLKFSFYSIPTLFFLLPVINPNILPSYPSIAMRFVYTSSIFSVIFIGEIFIIGIKHRLKAVVYIMISSLILFYLYTYLDFQKPFESNEVYLKTLTKVYPDEGSLKLRLAYVKAKKGDYTEALELTDKAIKLNYNNKYLYLKEDATIFKANLLLILNKKEEAKRIVLKILKNTKYKKSEYYSYLLLSKYYEKEKDWERAIEYLLKAKNISENADLFFRLSLVYFYAGNYSYSLHYLEKAKNLDPNLKYYNKLKKLILQKIK